MSPESRSRVIKVDTGSQIGTIWFIGFLFTLAFAKLVGWQILWGIFIWPYYLGLAVR